MAYFLKKSYNQKGQYLQIYQSFYDPERKKTAHKSYRPVGYVHELQAQGIEDPIAHFKEEVNQLNEVFKAKKQSDKDRKIGEQTPEMLLGYFPIRSIQKTLPVRKHLHFMQQAYGFTIETADVLEALIYARLVCPCSKYKTYYEVLPKLYGDRNFSVDQMYDTMGFFGDEYQKIIEVYNQAIHERYPFDFSKNYFDCTNFYFEIDREDDFRRRGPSKERHMGPLVGLGLLLDAQQIPLGMSVYPGNESEIPVMRRTIKGLKERFDVTGKTIRVADKGLNCGENIMAALKDGDGYLFSRSVKTLPETEKAWIFLEQDFVDVRNKKGELLYRYKECVDTFTYDVTVPEGGKRKVALTEKRVLTFNPELARKQKQEINRQIEKAKRLTLSGAKKSEFGDSAKYVRFQSTGADGQVTDERIALTLHEANIEKSLQLAGYNLLVSSEIHTSATELYQTYHNLWRIEESFKLMKSELDGRPVHAHKQSTITGHFLVCYLAVTLFRIWQIKVLDDVYGYPELMAFIRNFKVAHISERRFINLAKTADFIRDFADRSGLPLTAYYLKPSDIDKMMLYRV